MLCMQQAVNYFYNSWTHDSLFQYSPPIENTQNDLEEAVRIYKYFLKRLKLADLLS